MKLLLLLWTLNQHTVPSASFPSQRPRPNDHSKVTAKPEGVPEAFPPPRPGDSGGGPPPVPPAPRSGHTGSWQGENHLGKRSRLNPSLSGACPRPETGVPRRRPLPALRVLGRPRARVPRARAGGAAGPGEERGAARRGRRGGASGVGRAAEDAGCERGAEVAPGSRAWGAIAEGEAGQRRREGRRGRGGRRCRAAVPFPRAPETRG